MNKSISLWMVAAVMGCALPLVAQEYEGKSIKEVRFEGLERVSEQLVSSQVEIKAGQAFDQQAVSRDIRRLYDTTYFASITADVRLDNGEVVVTYVCEEKKVISEIKIVGNDKLRARAIRGVISWNEGDTFVQEGYEEEKQAILDLYRSKGIPTTTVDIVVEEIGASRVRVTYFINEGKKAKIRSVAIEGNDSLSDRQLKRGLETKKRRWFLGGKYDETKFESDLDKVITKYGDHGRLEAEVTGTDIAYSDNGKDMKIKINVQEGPEYTVGTMDVANNEVIDDDEILDVIEVKPGDVHNKSQVEEDAANVTKGYSDSGYINADVTPQVTLNRDDHTTNVVHDVEEGDLKYVKEVKITGNSVTRDEVIRRDIYLLPGDRFDGTLFEGSRRRLENSDYYEVVRMSLEDIDDDDRFANLLVDVDEGKTGFWNFGAGYNTDEGVGAYTELRFNNFDITNWPTFSGGGQQFRVRLAVGETRNEYNLSFTDPEFLGYPIIFGVDLYDESYHYEGSNDFTQESQGARLRLGKVLSPYNTVRTALDYRSINYSDMNTGPLSGYYEYIGGDVTISSIWGFNRTTTDSSRDPSTGARHDFQIEVAGLGGDNDFWKFDHDSQWFWSLDDDKKWVFSVRTRQGIGGAWGNSENIPLSDRYFAGGSSTIRGYESRDVGPTVKRYRFFGEEEAVGGELRLINNVELKYKVNKFFRLYTFLDSGGVWLTPSDFDFGEMKYGAGVGIGFDIPRMGPIRVDYGFALNPDEDQGSGQLHLQGGFRF